jgi:hypothetical protein
MARLNGSVGTTRGFSAAVNKWTKQAEERCNDAFQMGMLDFTIHLRDTTPIDTGYLRSSLTLGKNGAIPAGPMAEYGSNQNDQNILSVISTLKVGDRVSLVYNATYARRLEYGFTGMDSLGRNYNQAGRFWIRAASSRFVSIMRAAATRVRNGAKI